MSKRMILRRTISRINSKRKINRVSFSRSLNYTALLLDYSRVSVMARDTNMDHGSNIATRRFVTDGNLLVARLRHRSSRRGWRSEYGLDDVESRTRADYRERTEGRLTEIYAPKGKREYGNNPRARMTLSSRMCFSCLQ